MNPTFQPGRNIAMKVPAHEYASTVAFYRETLRLRELTPSDADGEQTPRFAFGDKVLWLDRVAGISQAEIWLEVVTDDLNAAADFLQHRHCARRDEIEPLPDGFRAFWISSPANIIHLISEQKLS
ncbi:VOC family protein [Stutzerimonas frequens]|uniref:VOC family protein n=1 Tax=Stutzerimonas frequens TaxID=2968969 RepID=UPI004037743C